ncbi:hypothetical protein ACOTJC_28805 [Achromobacter xylosoxidans]|uniref:hypothetical protein n=1 Tax=Alcaligenes xylosoxydans xylosoxydans TaxID=85698 RepID=UPI002E172797|nr:hypothetical protein [Achromobacter xylosoxidans]
MTSFPAYAKVLLSGYAEEADYGVLRTEMDSGIAKQRATRSLPIVKRTVVIHVETVSDKNAFDAWMRAELLGGVGWFDWLDPLDGIPKQARIVDGKLQWTSPGKVWRASGQIETVG